MRQITPDTWASSVLRTGLVQQGDCRLAIRALENHWERARENAQLASVSYTHTHTCVHICTHSAHAYMQDEHSNT